MADEDRGQVRELEKRLKLTEARFRALFDYSSDVLVEIDTSGTITDLNQKAENVSGYKKDEIVGKKISSLAGKFTAPSLALMVANFAKRMMGGHVDPYEVELIGTADQRLRFEVTSVFLKDDAGKTVGELAILRDITKWREAESKLSEKVKELEKMTSIMDGREDKIIELKNEIGELKRKLEQK